MPGGMRTHQAPLTTSPCTKAWLRMLPHEMAVGSPRPRKVSVVWARMALATVKVPETRMSGATFGSTCRTIIWLFPAPSAFARSTNGRASTASVCARRRRAVPAHEVAAMAIVMEVLPCPRTAESEMASGRLGSTMNQSVTVMRSRPVRPW